MGNFYFYCDITEVALFLSYWPAICHGLNVAHSLRRGTNNRDALKYLEKEEQYLAFFFFSSCIHNRYNYLDEVCYGVAQLCHFVPHYHPSPTSPRPHLFHNLKLISFNHLLLFLYPNNMSGPAKKEFLCICPDKPGVIDKRLEVRGYVYTTNPCIKLVTWRLTKSETTSKAPRNSSVRVLWFSEVRSFFLSPTHLHYLSIIWGEGW